MAPPVELSRGQQQRLLLWLAGGSILVAGWLVVLPAWMDWIDLRSRLDQVQAQTAQLSEPPTGRLVRQLATLEPALAAEARRFPVSENVSTLLVELQGVTRTGTDITRFYPTKLAPVALPDVATADVALSQQRVLIDAQGTFFELRAFLARLEAFPDPVQIRSIDLAQLTDATAPSGLLSLELELSAFLVDRPVGNPGAAGRALDYLVGQLQAQERTLPASLAVPVLPVRPGPLPPARPAPRATVVPASAPSRHARVRPDPLAAWKVLGVLAARGAKAAAIIGIGGKQMAVARGDVLPGGWMIEGVEPHAVFVRRGLVVRRLPFSGTRARP